MDRIDQSLLSELRRNARATISDLADAVGVTRATIRARIERLEQAGEIIGYTVVTRGQSAEMPVRAMMMIQIEGRGAERIMLRLTGLGPVTAVHSTNGRWDLIVELATRTLPELDAIIYRIRDIDGIISSETNLLLASRTETRLTPA